MDVECGPVPVPVPVPAPSSFAAMVAAVGSGLICPAMTGWPVGLSSSLCMLRAVGEGLEDSSGDDCIMCESWSAPPPGARLLLSPLYSGVGIGVASLLRSWLWLLWLCV